MDRTERQELGVQKWVDHKLKGTLNYATGFGKTNTALIAIKRFLNKNPTKSIIVVVPNEPLQLQWIEKLTSSGFIKNCTVLTMNIASSGQYICDFLIIDEIHRILADTLINILSSVKYKIILGLTATFERLDNRHEILNKYCPVVDVVTIDEAVENGWLSNYRCYQVLIEVEDIDKYLELNRKFYEYFSFFNFDFNVAMACATDWKYRIKYVNTHYHGNSSEEKKEFSKSVIINAMGFNRTLQARKAFIFNHPKKIEITNYILEHRLDKKSITFSALIKVAEQIKYGKVYTGKTSVKKGRITIDEFKAYPYGVLNTVSKLAEGFNCEDISVVVLLGIDNSSTKIIQKIGRALRKQGDKVSEIFTIVIKNTVEETWFKNSHKDFNYITIDEDGLKNLLDNKEYSIKKNKESNLNFRF